MHCHDGDPAHARHSRNVEPVYSAMPDFTCANPGVSHFRGRRLSGSPTRRFRCPATAGRGIPMPRPAWGASDARGHIEREDHDAKGRRDPRSRARRTAARARGRRGAECAHASYDCSPKSSSPDRARRTARMQMVEPLRLSLTARTPGGQPHIRGRRGLSASIARRMSRINATAAHPRGGGPPLDAVGASPTRCRRPCRRCRGSRRSGPPRPARSSLRNRRRHRGPCR